MTTKRIDKLAVGDVIAYQHERWRVTRIRPGSRPGSRDVRLRAEAEPHNQIEPLLGGDIVVEVVE